MNCVDDSNSVVSFSDPTETNKYIDKYFKMLGYFYRQNKLLLNPEKTNVLIIAKPGIRNEADDIKIMTETEEVKPKRLI